MNRSLVRHLLQIFFIPSAGLSLAWFGSELPVAFIPDLDTVQWGLWALLQIALLEWLAYRLHRLPAMALLCLTMAGLIVALPTVVLMTTRDMPGLGNLLDYAASVFAIFVLSLLSLRYRINVSITEQQTDAKTVIISGQFE